MIELNTHHTSREQMNSVEIQDWLITYLSELLDISQDEIDIRETFDSYGLDSIAAAGLTGELADWINVALEPTLLYEYPTIQKLAEFLVIELAVEK